MGAIFCDVCKSPLNKELHKLSLVEIADEAIESIWYICEVCRSKVESLIKIIPSLNKMNRNGGK